MTFRSLINTEARRGAAERAKGPAWPTKRLAENDGLSTKEAPGPTGPSGADAISWVRERRRQEREAEQRREREGR